MEVKSRKDVLNQGLGEVYLSDEAADADNVDTWAGLELLWCAFRNLFPDLSGATFKDYT